MKTQLFTESIFSSIDYLRVYEIRKEENILIFECLSPTTNSLKIVEVPLWLKKGVFTFSVFMALATTGFSSRFQWKENQFRIKKHWITEILVKMCQNQIWFIFTLYFTLFSMNIHIEIKELIENKHSKQMEWCKKSADTFHSIWKIFMNLETFYHVMSIKYWLIFQRQI